MCEFVSMQWNCCLDQSSYSNPIDVLHDLYPLPTDVNVLLPIHHSDNEQEIWLQIKSNISYNCTVIDR